MTTRQDAHCRIPGCPCTHGAGCYRGWIDHTDTRTGTERTTPCPTCRPDLHQRITKTPDPGHRDPGDLARLRHARSSW